MKPDQERIHTVLTDTISLLCRNGLNYEKELRVQGVIGVTIDDSEVFIVHINETFDTSNETADAALSSASVVDCERTTPPQSRLTSRLNQRCVVTDYPDLGSSLQKSNRLGRLKSRHPVKIPGYSQSPASCLPLRAGVVSPSLAGCSISENPVLPGTFPEKKHDEYGNVEKEPNDDSQECNSRMWVNEEHSKSDTVRDVVGSCHDVDSESVAVKEDNEEGMSSNNYNSVTSSVEDSNDAVHSDADLDDRYPGIDERRIKVESEVNSTDADKACNEFSALNSTSNTAYFPESRDLSFSMDVKTEGLEHHHPSANLLASDGYDAGGLPVRSRHLAHSLSPCQTTIKTEMNLEFLTSNKGYRMLSYGGYLFHLDGKSNEKPKQIWRCSDRPCKSRCHTENDRLTQEPTEHSHAPSVNKLDRARVRETMKRHADESECSIRKYRQVDPVVEEGTIPRSSQHFKRSNVPATRN